jgi:hypothetical protein
MPTEAGSVVGRILDADTGVGLAAQVAHESGTVSSTLDGFFVLPSVSNGKVSITSEGYEQLDFSLRDWPADGIIKLVPQRTATVVAVGPAGRTVGGAAVFYWREGDEWLVNCQAVNESGRTAPDGIAPIRLPVPSTALLTADEVASLPTRITRTRDMHQVNLVPSGRIGIRGRAGGMVFVMMESPIRSAPMEMAVDDEGVTKLALHPGVYQVWSDGASMRSVVTCAAGSIAWVTPRDMPVLNLHVVDAATGRPIADLKCVIDRILEYPSRPPFTSGRCSVTTDSRGEVDFSMPPLGGAGYSAVVYRVVAPGYVSGELRTSDGDLLGAAVRLTRQTTLTRVVLCAAAGTDQHFDVVRRSLPDMVLGSIHVQNGRGERAVPGPLSLDEMLICSNGVALPGDLVRTALANGVLEVDLREALGSVRCSNAPPDIVLVHNATLLRGRGVGNGDVEWPSVPVGEYIIIPETYINLGAADRGVRATVSGGRVTVVAWETKQVLRGSVVYMASASVDNLLVAPLIPVGNKVRLVSGVARSPLADGGYAIDGLGADTVAVCRLYNNEWEVVATGIGGAVINVFEPLDAFVDEPLARTVHAMMPASATLHLIDIKGREILDAPRRQVHVDRSGRFRVPSLPPCARNVVLSGQGKTVVASYLDGVIKVREQK